MHISYGPNENVQGDKHNIAHNLAENSGKIESSSVNSHFNITAAGLHGRRNPTTPPRTANSSAAPVSSAPTEGDGPNSHGRNTQTNTVVHAGQHFHEIPETSAMQPPIGEKKSDIQEDIDPSSTNDENPATPLDFFRQNDTSDTGEPIDAESDVSRTRQRKEDLGPPSKQRKVDRKELFLSKEKVHLYMRQGRFIEASRFMMTGYDKGVDNCMGVLNYLECVAYSPRADLKSKDVSQTLKNEYLSKGPKKLMDEVATSMTKFGVRRKDVQDLAEIASKDRGMRFRSVVLYRIASLLCKSEKDPEGLMKCIHCICEIKEGKSLNNTEKKVYINFVIPLLKKMRPEVNTCRKTKNYDSLEEALKDAEIQTSIAKVEISAGKNKEARKRLQPCKNFLEKKFGDNVKTSDAYIRLNELLKKTK